MQLIIVNKKAFLYLEGKLVSLKNIVSLVASHRHDNRTMMYLDTTDKALAFETSVGEGTQVLADVSDEATEDTYDE